MAEETKQKEVTFVSRYLNLRIVVQPGYSKEVDGRRVSTPGRSIRFFQGAYKTSDPEEIEFLRTRPEFGKHIQEVPDNVEEMAAREEQFKNLEDKEKELAEREAALAAREAALTNQETGRQGEEGEEGEDEDDGLEAMERGELIDHLKKLKEEDPEGLEEVNGNSKSEDIIAAIRAREADKPSFDE